MRGSVTVTGPPGVDLALEGGDHAAAAAEHVAEAHRAVAVAWGARRAASCSASHFDAPMTLVGVAALSVEMHTRLVAPWRSARVDDVQRAEHVGADGLARVALEDRHVLVRGGVEHDLGAARVRRRRRPPRRRGCRRARSRPTSAGLEGLDRVVEVGLVVVEQHQARGLELRDLPGDLRADPAAAAGDEHTLAPRAARAPARGRWSTWSRPRRSSMSRSRTSRSRGMPCAHDVDDRSDPHGDVRAGRRRRRRAPPGAGGASGMARRIWLISCSFDDLVEVARCPSRSGRRGWCGCRSDAVVVDRDDGHEPEAGRLLHLAERGGAADARRPTTATRVPPPR